MKKNVVCFLVFQCMFFCLFAQNSGFNSMMPFDDQQQKSVIELRLDPNDKREFVKIEHTLINCMYSCGLDSVNINMKKGIGEWTNYINEPYWIYTGKEFGKENAYWLAEPGDRVVMTLNRGNLNFSGYGSEKFELLYKLNSLKSSLKKELSNPVDYFTRSLEDYLEWCRVLNKQYLLSLQLIDSYKTRISPNSFNFIRDITLDGLIDNRTDKFYTFLGYAKKAGISKESICDIYDSTYAPFTINEYLPSMSRTFLGSWGPVRLQVTRRYNFDFSTDVLSSKARSHMQFYELALKSYKGLVREKFLMEFLTDKMIGALGFIPEVEEALAKYYAEPGYPEYKKYVKDFELRARALRNDRPAPEFSLKDIKGNVFTKEDLKGKVALIDFWFTGCVGCKQLTPILKRIENTFRNDTNVIFISVSIDQNKDSWLKSIKENKYSTEGSIKLYTEGLGDKHEMLKSYNVTGYPTIYLIDGRGNVRGNPLPKDEDLIVDAVKKQLVLLKDGPYVIHQKNETIAHAVYGTNAMDFHINKDSLTFNSQTDEYGKLFTVKLKKSLMVEPAEFDQPQKLMAISDIEGNFEAFRRLLQSNKVIDNNYNWTFGNGHLVLAGDMFDRGEQVTECLWLIYSLEDKAKAAGGYVHFILGNHEIMNLNGETQYGHQKYKDNVKKIGTSYTELYNKDSELGRWLRTKNIIEKIGDVLFVHGGINKEIIDLSLSVSQLNALARPYYDKQKLAQISDNKALSLLFNSEDKLSPFWHRSYYMGSSEMKIKINGSKGVDTVYKTPMKVIDAALNNFKVNRIVTGHTIVDDTVSVHYDSKVINIDTRHAKNKSEALLVENNMYYRVNASGSRVFLFKANLNQAIKNDLKLAHN